MDNRKNRNTTPVEISIDALEQVAGGTDNSTAAGIRCPCCTYFIPVDLHEVIMRGVVHCPACGVNIPVTMH